MIPVVDISECPSIIKKPAFTGVYTDSCCTEGHVKRDTAYCGYICSFVCDILHFTENSMSRLGSWSRKQTRLWVGGRRYRGLIFRRGNSVFQAF